jgi:hypothetical protein
LNQLPKGGKFMNEKELYALLTELQTKPHRLVINNSDYFKYVWDDGTTE